VLANKVNVCYFMEKKMQIVLGFWHQTTKL